MSVFARRQGCRQGYSNNLGFQTLIRPSHQNLSHSASVQSSTCLTVQALIDSQWMMIDRCLRDGLIVELTTDPSIMQRNRLIAQIHQ